MQCLVDACLHSGHHDAQHLLLMLPVILHISLLHVNQQLHIASITLLLPLQGILMVADKGHGANSVSRAEMTSRAEMASRAVWWPTRVTGRSDVPGRDDEPGRDGEPGRGDEPGRAGMTSRAEIMMK